MKYRICVVLSWSLCSGWMKTKARGKMPKNIWRYFLYSFIIWILNTEEIIKVVDPDYYEFESHIFFDDAFDTDESGKCVINKFVRQLIEKVDEAARWRIF